MENSQASSDGTGVKKLITLVATLLLTVVVDAQPVIRLKTKQTAAKSQSASVPQNTLTPGHLHWLVQFQNAPSLSQLSELRRQGAQVLSYVPDFALSVTAGNDTNWDGLKAYWIGQLQPQEKISPNLAAILAAGVKSAVLVESYSDVAPGDVRAIASLTGVLIQENPDLLANHLLVWANAQQVQALAGWDEISYIFPASANLAAGTPVHGGCPGALTTLGPVTQSVPLIDDGWSGPSHGPANLNYSFVNVTEKLPADAAESEITRALAEWAQYVNVDFTLTNDATADRTIAIEFVTGAHGDGYPFTSASVLAHTFYPVPTGPRADRGRHAFQRRRELEHRLGRGCLQPGLARGRTCARAGTFRQSRCGDVSVLPHAHGAFCRRHRCHPAALPGASELAAIHLRRAFDAHNAIDTHNSGGSFHAHHPQHAVYSQHSRSNASACAGHAVASGGTSAAGFHGCVVHCVNRRVVRRDGNGGARVVYQSGIFRDGASVFHLDHCSDSVGRGRQHHYHHGARFFAESSGPDRDGDSSDHFCSGAESPGASVAAIAW